MTPGIRHDVGMAAASARRPARRPTGRAAPRRPPTDGVSGGRDQRADRHTFLVVLALIIAVTLAVRLRIADIPLERDEGEYAYAAQLLLDGLPPYRLAYNMKFPGAYYAYAAIMAVFGENAAGIRSGLLLVNLSTAGLVWMIGRRLIGPEGGAAAACVFALMSLDRWIMGPFGHATHFVLLPALGALALISGATTPPARRRLFAAGCLLGVAVLMKQHAVAFVALGMGWAFWISRQAGSPPGRAARDAMLVGLGAAVPLAAISVMLLWQGVFGTFWFWTVGYASRYVGQVGWGEAAVLLRYALAEISRATLLLWLLGLVGAGLLWTTRWPANTRLFLSALPAAAVAAIVPGFFFRQHYFILLLPAISLLAGVTIQSVTRRFGRLTAAGLLAVTLSSYLAAEHAYLWTMPPTAISRAVYGANPFVEAPAIARYIAERTDPGERIAVLGSEPQIYFYARRRSATGYIYTYPLVEQQPFASQMQAEMIAEIEAGRPAYLVMVQVRSSWLPQPGASQRIFTWGRAYTNRCYELAGVADIPEGGDAVVLWDAAARSYTPRSGNVVLTFRRADTCRP